MPSSSSMINTLEDLPDELFLLIFRYLSSPDILFSFYGLNSRLSQTISGYCRYVVLAQVPFKQFHDICKSILPAISNNIHSLIVSNQWKGILSKIFLSYFGEKMSLTFSHLKHLAFISFTDNSLNLFLDYLENFTELHDIRIYQLTQRASSSIKTQTLLHKIFIANNNQLNSVFFDDESIVFSLDDTNSDILYTNIKKLSIDLQTINDLHRLLTRLPQLISINVTINKESIELEKLNENIPVVTLKQFQLQSFSPSWTLSELGSLIQRIPNVEELSIAIESGDDVSLLDGEKFLSLFVTLSLKKFAYFLRFYDRTCSIDHTKIPSTWEQFKQEFTCIKNDDKTMLVLYTLPFYFSYLILPNSLAKIEAFIESYALKVKDLTLCDIPKQTIDIFTVVRKCHRLHTLTLRIENNNLPEVPKQIQLCKLPYLTKIVVLRRTPINSECFRTLLEVSPTLYHLVINFESLQPLFDDEFMCLLLKQRITHLYILVSSSTILKLVISSINHFSSTFPSLKHHYFGLEKGCEASELLVLTVLHHLYSWNSLISFGVVNAKMTQETLSKGIQEWVIENSTLNEYKSFVIDYTDEIFRLWL